jgi:hypothetical protein
MLPCAYRRGHQSVGDLRTAATGHGRVCDGAIGGCVGSGQGVAAFWRIPMPLEKCSSPWGVGVKGETVLLG